ncbi:hypothetical protein INH39_32865 [Massilia violaceinigra]|uniref:YcxB-like protein domain-containing protein n=1 Tax=Massilia violaceinigra TaxID=2045208 RepID=A0ABY4ABV8_9BURK|nr:hypothetical protein [Massilia violaceinigra]UOD30083.1 hypothetical protein INH39_32865 [Massilia violaceinigra]
MQTLFQENVPMPQAGQERPRPHVLLRLAGYFAIAWLIAMPFGRMFGAALPVVLILWGVAGCVHFAADIVDLFPAIRHAARRSVAEKWNGRYYAYYGAHIRLCLVDGMVWIVEEDVRKIMSPPVTGREQRLLGADYAMVGGTGLHGYSEQGLLRLIQVRLMRRGGEAEMKKFIAWLQNEALPNVKRVPASSAI